MSPKSLLLVEDNPGDVVLMRAALKRAGVDHQLLVAQDAYEALDILYRRNGKEQAPAVDIGIFDINLPGMTGIDLLEKVKSDPDLKATPVIMLTSSDLPMDIQNSYERHANCYLTKPADMEGLVHMVRAIEEFWISLVHMPNHATSRARSRTC